MPAAEIERLGEFDLIDRYLADSRVCRSDVSLGIGDDAAVLAVPPDREVVVAMVGRTGDDCPQSDTVAGAFGHQLLAEGLSQLAAQGAEASWMTLGLTLPRADAGWLAAFSAGLFSLAQRHQVALVGGDTTRGPWFVTLIVHGLVPCGGRLHAGGARTGDRLFLSGEIGTRVALEQGGLGADELRRLTARQCTPSPPLPLGRDLRTLASAAVDTCGGLEAAAVQMANSSAVGIQIDLSQLPVAKGLRAAGAQTLSAITAASGDHELCFACAAEKLEEVQRIAGRQAARITEIGRVIDGQGVTFVTPTP